MNSIQVIRRCFFWILVGIFYLAAGLAAAHCAEISDVVINSSRGYLNLSLKIRDAVTEKIMKPANDGVSSSIVFSIVLYQVNSFWFDKTVAHQTATNTLRYDPSKKKYSLIRSWYNGPPMVVGTLDQAKKLMIEIMDLRLMPLDGLERGRKYQIRVQAVCQDPNAFIFGPSGCFKTDWYTVDFTF